MRKNAVKSKLKNGQCVFGTMIKEILNLDIDDAQIQDFLDHGAENTLPIF